MLRASNIAAFAIGMEILSIGTAAYAQEIGDIVVTAQRRQERLQDVPIAVSVVTSDQMTKAGINNTDALGSAVPGLVVSRGQNTGAIYLRGVGTQNAAVGDENSVALYIDGVYVFSPSASIFNFSNIERIEVLRGPQGTLFGRNAVGGLIQVVTRDPKQDPSADLSVGYGNYKTVTASAYLTGGITQNIAADISGFYMKQRKGFGTNIFNGQDVNKSEEGAVRSKWLIDPTESLQIRVAGG
jgi:iron complex outermembrane receptor protein